MSKYQVKYVDSNGETQVISVLGTGRTDTDLDADSDTVADRALITRQGQGFQKAKIYADSNLIGKVPLKNSSYDNALNDEAEPEILIEEWNGSSWDRIFRGFAKSKPSSDKDGQALLVLHGFGRYLGKQDDSYSTGGTTTSLDTILSNLLPNGYTVDTAPAADWDGGSVPEIENYRFNGERQVAYRELAKNHNAAIIFTSDLSSGNYKVRLEPIGHGGTVDTIYSPRDLTSSSDTLGTIREWSGETIESVVNKVKVVGTNSNNTKVSATESDSTSINDYGTKFLKKNIPYVESSSEASTLANNLLEPDPSQGGVVKVPRYNQRVVNSSFQLEASEHNVSDVFTAVKTRNYLHEQAVELVFEFETGSEKPADNQVETVYERTKVYPSSTIDVGNQSLTTGDALSNTAATGGVGDGNDRNDDLSNVAKTGGVQSAGGASEEASSQQSFSGQTVSANSNATVATITAPSSDVEGADVYFSIHVALTASASNFSPGDLLITEFDVAAERQDDFTEFPNVNIKRRTDHAVLDSDNDGTADRVTQANFDGVIHIPENVNGTDIELEIIPDRDISIFGEVNLVTYQEHSHGDDIDTDNQSMGLTDDIDTDDNQHGGGTGDDQHGGSTESNVNVDTATEDKTDR